MGSTYGHLAQTDSEQAIWDCCSLPAGDLRIKFQQTYPLDGTSAVKDLDLCFQNYLHVDSSTSGLAVQMLADNGDVNIRNHELYKIWERIEEGKTFLSPAFAASDPRGTGTIATKTAIEILREAFSEFDEERVRMVADYFLPTFPLPEDKCEPVELDKLVFIYAMTHLDQDRQRRIHGRGDLSAQSSAISFEAMRMRQQLQDQMKFEYQQKQFQQQIDEEEQQQETAVEEDVEEEEEEAIQQDEQPELSQEQLAQQEQYIAQEPMLTDDQLMSA